MTLRLTTPAFVLRTWPLGESDRIVSLFSREEGKLRGVAPGAAASRRRFGGALSVLAEVEVSYVEKEGAELGRLEACELIVPTPGEGRDLAAFYAASRLAELLDQFARERQPEPKLYRLTQACAGALAAESDAEMVARYFEVWMLRLAGLLPDPAACGACGRDLQEGGGTLAPEGELLCRTCSRRLARGGKRLPASALHLMRRMLRLPPAELGEAGRADLDSLGAFAVGLFESFAERPLRVAMVREVPGGPEPQRSGRRRARSGRGRR